MKREEGKDGGGWAQVKEGKGVVGAVACRRVEERMDKWKSRGKHRRVGGRERKKGKKKRVEERAERKGRE